MNHKERSAQINQRGRLLDFFFDQFLTKCEVRTSQENKEEGLLISLSTSSKRSLKKGLHTLIKGEDLFKSLRTSSKPSMKKGLHKKIKEEGPVISFSTSCK